MKHEGWIVRNKEILGGKPTIKGTRISVELILEKMSNGYSIDDVLDAYPQLTKEAIQACFDYVKCIMVLEEVIELNA
jgi:uncharacterized protein (DUF433 family)